MVPCQGFDFTDTVSMLLDKVVANPVSLMQPEFFKIGVFARWGDPEVIVDGVDPLVDVLAQLGDLALRDAGEAHRLHQLSTRRVDTPPIQASWMTATSAFSAIWRGSRRGGK